jgi:hypothetical protein
MGGFLKSHRGGNALALVDKTTMYVFPRRAFSQEQWAEYISLVRERVPVWDGAYRSIRSDATALTARTLVSMCDANDFMYFLSFGWQ